MTVPQLALLNDTSVGPDSAPQGADKINLAIAQVNRMMRETLSLGAYLPAAYNEVRLSAPLNNSASTVSCTTGSNIITCVSGCNWQLSDVGSAIVVLQEHTVNQYQSTIVSVQSTTQCTLADPATYTSTNSFCYFGTDLTAYIDAWWGDCLLFDQAGHVPGIQAFYNGSGITGWNSPCIRGDLNIQSMFFLGISKYLIDGNEFWLACAVTDIGIFGGAGLSRNRFTGVNVTSAPFLFDNVYCRDYTGAAISFNASDMPYIAVNRPFFQGLNTITPVGIASAGQGPIDVVYGKFITNRYGAKAGNGGINWSFSRCDFIEFQGEATPGSYERAAIWLVPDPVAANGSIGLSIDGKFGNENIDVSDVRILLADTAANSTGVYFGDTTPLTTASAGYITGMTISEETMFAGGFVGANPIIYSYVPPANFRLNQIAGNLQGTYPGYIVEFDAVVLPAPNDRTSGNNTFGRFRLNGFGPNNMLLSNVPGLGMLLDPNGDFSTWDYGVLPAFMVGSSPSDLINLLTTPITGFSVVGGGSITPIIDAQLGAECVTLTMGAVNGGNEFFARLATEPVIGKQCWLHLFLRQGSTGTSLNSLAVSIADHTSSPLDESKECFLAPTWREYPIPFVYRSAGVNVPSNVQLQSVGGAAIGQTVDVGILRVYQASQPVSGGAFIRPVWMTSALVQPPHIITATGAITIGPNDYRVGINKTTGASSAVALPATPQPGRQLVIYDAKGDAATNNITITPNAGNIDGSATLVINTAWGIARLEYTGTIWKTV